MINIYDLWGGVKKANGAMQTFYQNSEATLDS